MIDNPRTTMGILNRGLGRGMKMVIRLSGIDNQSRMLSPVSIGNARGLQHGKGPRICPNECDNSSNPCGTGWGVLKAPRAAVCAAQCTTGTSKSGADGYEFENINASRLRLS